MRFPREGFPGGGRICRLSYAPAAFFATRALNFAKSTANRSWVPLPMTSTSSAAVMSHTVRRPSTPTHRTRTVTVIPGGVAAVCVTLTSVPTLPSPGYMVGLMEWACIEAMAPHMEPGEGSVGTLVNMTHTAATPPGMTVTVRVRCVGVEGRRSVWDIEAKDDVEVIGRGTHERFAVDFAKFNARVAKKAAGASGSSS